MWLKGCIRHRVFDLGCEDWCAVFIGGLKAISVWLLDYWSIKKHRRIHHLIFVFKFLQQLSLWLFNHGWCLLRFWWRFFSSSHVRFLLTFKKFYPYWISGRFYWLEELPGAGQPRCLRLTFHILRVLLNLFVLLNAIISLGMGVRLFEAGEIRQIQLRHNHRLLPGDFLGHWDIESLAGATASELLQA